MQKKGGKKNKRVKHQGDEEKRCLLLKDDMQEYAKIVKPLGNRRMTVLLPDNTETIAVIPGRFRKRSYITSNNIVLISRRGFEDKKVDIIHRYSVDEAKQLYKKLEIPGFFLDIGSSGSGSVNINNEIVNDTFDFNDI